METKDSVGNVLNDGDSVLITKTLDVKGMAKTLKRGDKIKNIRTIGDPQNIECRIGKNQLVIKTQFIKKA